MRNFNNKISAVVLTLAYIAGLNAQNLPVKEILGQQYYVYEVKKGDSIYGIAHRFGWDEKELIRLNPTIANGLKKGETIYYPTGKIAVVEVEPEEPTVVTPEDLPVLEHIVKRGETVYSIAKMYDIPISVIYESYPSARKGIKAGEKIIIDQNKSGFGDPASIPFFYVTIKPGDTLYSTAKKYELAIEDILRVNPGISERNFKAGAILKIPTQDRVPKVKRTLVEVQTVESISPYKVDKNDTWSSISAKTGVGIEELKEANADISKPKKNDILAVPSLETDTIEKLLPYNDPREQSSSGRKEIYDSIHHIDSDQAIKNVRMALLMEDPNGRRDIEFTRGFLMALKELGNPGYKVDFKVLASNIPAEDIIIELDAFRPQVVFTLSDKGVSDWILDYSARTGTEAINVFDAKTDTYTSAPSIIQLLTPSGYFNESVGKQIAGDFGGRKVVLVTKGSSIDPMAEAIISNFPEEDYVKISLDNLTSGIFPVDKDILLIADLTEKEDILNLLGLIQKYKEENPVMNISIVGRPSWVTYTESMGEKFYEGDVMIPSRFYFNPDNELGKSFIEDFTEIYGRGPLKSYPNYAATGYDSANWFIPALAMNEGDFNVKVPKNYLLQMPIELKRASNWGGFYNTSGMLIHFTPWRTIEVGELR